MYTSKRKKGRRKKPDPGGPSYYKHSDPDRGLYTVLEFTPPPSPAPGKGNISKVFGEKI